MAQISPLSPPTSGSDTHLKRLHAPKGTLQSSHPIPSPSSTSSPLPTPTPLKTRIYTPWEGGPGERLRDPSGIGLRAFEPNSEYDWEGRQVPTAPQTSSSIRRVMAGGQGGALWRAEDSSHPGSQHDTEHSTTFWKNGNTGHSLQFHTKYFRVSNFLKKLQMYILELRTLASTSQPPKIQTPPY